MASVLFLGKSDRRIESWAKAHAAHVKSDRLNVLFLAPYGRNYSEDNFTFINCFTVPVTYTLADIQARLPVSLNRALACDRSLTDYTFSLSHRTYSRYTPEQIERLLLVMGNALLQYMPEVEYCVEGLFDNFIAPLAYEIARACQVPFYMIKPWQYWHTRFHIVDLPGYVSSQVNDHYRRYLSRVRPAMYTRIKEEFTAARFKPVPFHGEGWRLRMQIIWDKMHSYERPSLLNLLKRHVGRLFGPFGAAKLRFAPREARPERYVLFALHVMPEASILGTDPEIADQFSLIRRISLNLPAGVRLLCKAHPGERFGRDIEIAFLRRLYSLHNVDLVPESEGIDSFIGDSRCLAIATINGSVALEAVMAGKACFLFGQGMFAVADCFLKPRDDREFFLQAQALVEKRYSVDQVAVAAIILAMKRATIEGSRSLRNPGTWLEYYSALLPAVHAYHLRMSA